MVTHNAWAEYDSVCEWMARKGLRGVGGDTLPTGISSTCFALIHADPEAFQKRIRECSYAQAMERVNVSE